MAESVIRALYAKSTSLNLSSKKIKNVPKCVSRLTNLSVLLLKNNSITALPVELISLQHVSLFRLLWKIAKITLKMFYTARRFVIKYISFCTTYKLTELNLGNNALKEVPAVLGHLESLRKLYLFSNQITVVPHEVMGRFLAAPHDLHLGRFVKS